MTSVFCVKQIQTCCLNIVNEFSLYTRHQLMVALVERKTNLSFARNWCNVALIDELESDIKK